MKTLYKTLVLSVAILTPTCFIAQASIRVPQGEGLATNYYTMLGVDKRADFKDIHEAYQKFMKPLAGDTSQQGQILKEEAKHAMEVLQDADKRAVYDEELDRREQKALLEEPIYVAEPAKDILLWQELQQALQKDEEAVLVEEKEITKPEEWVIVDEKTPENEGFVLVEEEKTNPEEWVVVE